jgi:hypothetical protein
MKIASLTARRAWVVAVNLTRQDLSQAVRLEADYSKGISLVISAHLVLMHFIIIVLYATYILEGLLFATTYSLKYLS